MVDDGFATARQELARAKAALARGHIAENSTKDDSTRKDIIRENGSRPATVEMTYTAYGIGQQRVAKPLIFPTAFRTEPHFTFGFGTKSNPAPKTWNDPIAQVGISAWRRNNRGLYTGVYFYYRIDAYPIATVSEAPPQFATKLYLTFTAMGTKLSKDNAYAEALAALKEVLPGIK